MKKFKKIYIEITNICNLNCPFCSKDNKVKREMKTEEFEHILKEINDYTDYLYLHVKGEPLLHSNFKNILDICKKYNKKVNVTTNGTLLIKRLEDILNSSVRQVNISLHSLISDTYLESILKSGLILSNNNIQVVYRFWVENNNQNEIINKLIKFYNIKLEDDFINVKIKDNMYINKDLEFQWPSLDNEFISDKGRCYGLITHIGILSDGTVIPCCLDSSGVIELGNVFKESFKNIMNKERTNNIIKGFQDNKLIEDLCQKCDFRKRVSHDKGKA